MRSKKLLLAAAVAAILLASHTLMLSGQSGKQSETGELTERAGNVQGEIMGDPQNPAAADLANITLRGAAAPLVQPFLRARS